MAVKPPRTIPLPPKTQAKLHELVNSQRMLQAQIDSIVATARDILIVPEEYVITSIDVGFVPPPAPASKPPAEEPATEESVSRETGPE